MRKILDLGNMVRLYLDHNDEFYLKSLTKTENGATRIVHAALGNPANLHLLGEIKYHKEFETVLPYAIIDMKTKNKNVITGKIKNEEYPSTTLGQVSDDGLHYIIQNLANQCNDCISRDWHPFAHTSLADNINAYLKKPHCIIGFHFKYDVPYEVEVTLPKEFVQKEKDFTGKLTLNIPVEFYEVRLIR